MCGIAGIYHFDSSPIDTKLLSVMSDTARHRGPDDEGFVLINTKRGLFDFRSGNDTVECLKKNMKSITEETKISDLGLAHRRLSILDLSENGHQPMCDEKEDLVIVFNGEIYNYKEIRNELEGLGYTFKSNCDTEVIIYAYKEWNEECLKKFNGMWAFAIWDKHRATLFCSRDRFGVKPFYYYFDDKRFVFSSEIKQLLEAGFIAREPDDQVVFDFLFYSIKDHSENTFFKGIKQLLPGHYLKIINGNVNIGVYWDINSKNKKSDDINFCKKEFRNIFGSSVNLRLRSDVPVGTALSGGIDSSAIVCMMDFLLTKSGSSSSIKTFSSVFSDLRFDESKYVDEVVKDKNIQSFKVQADPIKLQDELDKLIWHQDEPFVTLSIYAQWNVMRLASQNGIKVMLDGQGGDEILAGYNYYFMEYFIELTKKLKFKTLKNEFSGYSLNTGITKLKILIMTIKAIVKRSSKAIRRLYYNPSRTNKVLNEVFFRNFNHEIKRENKLGNYLDNMLYYSITRNDLRSFLHYEDRNSMAFSIESRVPFLDFRLVEFMFNTSDSMKINHGVTKYLLRESLSDIMPRSIIERKDKMGFVTPQEEWQKNELKDYIKEIISSERFKKRKYFNSEKVNIMFDGFMSGQNRFWHEIWRCIIIELWLRKFIDK